MSPDGLSRGARSNEAKLKLLEKRLLGPAEPLSFKLGIESFPTPANEASVLNTRHESINQSAAYRRPRSVSG